MSRNQEKKHNFCAGPCILPESVFQEASEAVLQFGAERLSILEISHRSKAFVAVMEEARSLALETLGLSSETYTAIFLQGGASMQFLSVPFSFLGDQESAAYLNTGTWSKKAIAEAKRFGAVVEVGSSKDTNFDHIPKGFSIPSEAAYFHTTSNNTIFGTQIQDFPEVPEGVLNICDMSSDIFSRTLDFSKFDMIYAGAQKNLGPAGATLVIMKKSLLENTKRDVPTMLDYSTHVSKDSMFNTPPVFSIYVSLLTLRWLKSIGGIEAMEKLNNKKAETLYAEIDRNPYFEGHAAKEDRSRMNVTFRLKDEQLTDKFDMLWNAADLSGLKGHRSVGGYRASLYNALPLESVEVLVSTMKELEKIA